MPGDFTLAVSDADQYRLMVAGIPISNGAGASGYGEDEFLKIAMAEDAFITVVGADGTTVRSKSNNRLVNIDLTLMQSSVSNTALSALYAMDTNQANGAGIGSFVLQDLQGTTLILCTKCWIRKPAEVTLKRAASTRTWNITGLYSVMLIGNN